MNFTKVATIIATIIITIITNRTVITTITDLVLKTADAIELILLRL